MAEKTRSRGGSNGKSTSKQQATSPANDKQGSKGTRMRVWWSPTKDPAKTGFAGAWWPVKIVSKKTSDKFSVEYDNGELEDVLGENMSPADLPVDFGKEELPLQPGEFCEVFNGSQSDPCAWVAVVVKQLSDGSFMVNYPFHDTDPETIPAHRIRRARLMDDGEWKLLRPHQHWKDGDVLSPKELETIPESELGQFVNLPKVSKSSAASDKAEGSRGRGSAATTPSAASAATAAGMSSRRRSKNNATAKRAAEQSGAQRPATRART